MSAPKSHWNYRVVRSEYTLPTGEVDVTFALHEAHYTAGRVTGITENAVRLEGYESAQALADVLTTMFSDVTLSILKKHPKCRPVLNPDGTDYVEAGP